jgi:alkylhydroperoxidase family enzyme
MTWLFSPEAQTDPTELRPQAFRALSGLTRATRASTDPATLDLVRLRLAQTLGCDVALRGADPQQLRDLDRWESSEAFSPDQRAALAYSEQFLMDPNGLTEEQKDDLEHHFSREGAARFVEALNAHEGELRLLTLLALEPNPPAPLEPETDVATARQEFRRAALTDAQLDPVVSELCRLRNANHQSCHY